MVSLRSLESYLSDNLLSLTGNKLSFLMGPDLLKVHEAISKVYEEDTQEDHPFSTVAASKMRLSEILNLSFVKFLIEAHFMKIGGFLREKNMLDKKGEKLYVEFQNSLDIPHDIIDLLSNSTPEGENELFEKYGVPNKPRMDFTLTTEFFNYIGSYQDILQEGDPQKLSIDQEELLSKNSIFPLMKIFGCLFNQTFRPRLISESLVFPYNPDKKLGGGTVGDLFREVVHKEVLEQNSESDYKNIPIKKYTTDAINLAYNALDSDTFDHYKNSLQSFFLTPFYSHTININLHIPSPILPEGLIKDGTALRKEISILTNEYIQNQISKKFSNSFKKILELRYKILRRVSLIPISGNVIVTKERKFSDLYPQIKSKLYPGSDKLKKSGSIREFSQKFLEDSVTIFGQKNVSSLYITDIPSTVKMITFFSLSGKGIHGGEVEDGRIIPRIRIIHQTHIRPE